MLIVVVIFVAITNVAGLPGEPKFVTKITTGMPYVPIPGGNLGREVADLDDIDGDGVRDYGLVEVNGTEFALLVLFMNNNLTVRAVVKTPWAEFPCVTDYPDLNTIPDILVLTEVWSIGDFNDDGMPDVIVNADRGPIPSGCCGAVFIMFFNRDGTLQSDYIDLSPGNAAILLMLQNTAIVDLADTMKFGESIAVLGDMDGNGVVDIAVGAFGSAQYSAGDLKGNMYILFLNRTGLMDYVMYNNVNTGSLVNSGHYFFAYGLLAQDHDGDGVMDLIVGCPWQTFTSVTPYIQIYLTLYPNGTLKNATAQFEDFRLKSPAYGGLFQSPYHYRMTEGWLAVGDIDNNGVNDMLMPAGERRQVESFAYPDLGKGRMWLLLYDLVAGIPQAQNISQINASSFDASFFPNTSLSEDLHFAYGTAMIPDIDGDGYQDILFSVLMDDEYCTDCGSAFIMSLSRIACDGGLDSGAYVNDCGYCVGASTGLTDDHGKDCAGVCGGSHYYDCAGRCAVCISTGVVSPALCAELNYACDKLTPPCTDDQRLCGSDLVANADRAFDLFYLQSGNSTLKCSGPEKQLVQASAQVDFCGDCYGGTQAVQVANASLPCCLFLPDCSGRCYECLSTTTYSAGLCSALQDVCALLSPPCTLAEESCEIDVVFANADRAFDLYYQTVGSCNTTYGVLTRASAALDDCDECSGGATGVEANSSHDCNGVCSGPSVPDCQGNCAGDAEIDGCGLCTGGTTGLVANETQDCFGECGGTAYVDGCGVCSGGSTGHLPESDRNCRGICFGPICIAVPPPRVDSCSPGVTSFIGRDHRILGVHFQYNAKVYVGLDPNTTSTFIDPSNMQFLSPVLTREGYRDVTVINPDGGTHVLIDGLFYTVHCPFEGMFGLGLECSECPPVGAVCPGGYRMWPKEGYWTDDETTGQVIECKRPRNERCKGGRFRECGAGYTGYGCGECNDGYQEYFDECVKCDSSSQSRFYGLLTASISFFGLFLGAIVACSDINLTKVVNVLTSLQIVSGLGKHATSDMPALTRRLYSVLSILLVDFEYLEPGCTFQSAGFSPVFWGNLTLMVIVTASISLVLGVLALINPGKRSFWINRLWRSNIINLHIFHLNEATRCLQALYCWKNDIGDVFLVVQPSMQCFSAEHTPLFLVSFTMFLAYILGYPVFWTFWIHKNEPRFHDKTLTARMGYVYEQFTKGNGYFFPLELVISLGIAANTAFLDHDPMSQYMVSLCSLTPYLLLILVRKPFNAMWKNMVNVLVLLASLASTVVNLLVHTDTVSSENGLAAASIAIYFLVIGTLLAAVCILLYIPIQYITRRARVSSHSSGHMVPINGSDEERDDDSENKDLVAGAPRSPIDRSKYLLRADSVNSILVENSAFADENLAGAEAKDEGETPGSSSSRRVSKLHLSTESDPEMPMLRVFSSAPGIATVDESKGHGDADPPREQTSGDDGLLVPPSRKFRSASVSTDKMMHILDELIDDQHFGLEGGDDGVAASSDMETDEAPVTGSSEDGN